MKRASEKFSAEGGGSLLWKKYHQEAVEEEVDRNGECATLGSISLPAIQTVEEVHLPSHDAIVESCMKGWSVHSANQ